MTNQEAIKTIEANYPPEKYSMLREALDMDLALLKEKEPVEPWLSYDGNEYIFHCSNCDYEIYHNGDSRDEYKAKEYAIFCRHCGRKVKWDA